MNWFTRLFYGRMLPLAELLDDRQFETKGGSMMGLYHGRSVTFSRTTGEGSRKFSVALSCRSPFSSMIQKGRKRKRDKKMTLYGVNGPDLILSNVEIGDPELDRQILFWCDSPQSFSDWKGRPGVKGNVASLVLAEWVDSLQLGHRFLAITYSRSGFYVMGINFRTSLKEEMAPWNVKLVLQKLESLAQSLESIMGEETSDDTA